MPIRELNTEDIKLLSAPVSNKIDSYRLFKRNVPVTTLESRFSDAYPLFSAFPTAYTHLSFHVSHHSEHLYHLLLGPTVIIVVPDEPGYGSHVHTHDHGGSEAPDGSPDSILSSEPKPLEKHRTPPLPSILSLGESSYPP
ncbi:hypothetical protein Tco_1396893 [Tanacetum coccineum]